MTSFILNENIVNEEESVQRQINDSILQGESFHFIAGAGSGKTYALVESIKFHLSNKPNWFYSTGRKIACITYTNAAKDEIIERLYENDSVSVSTIHTFLWGLVEPHQDELVLIHKKNLEKQVKDIEFSLHYDDVNGTKPAYKKFRSLESEQDKLIKIINDDHSCFYQILQSTVASDFWSKLEEKLGNELYSSIKSKVQDVERIIRDIIKISKYRKCIDNITDKKDGYSTVKYNEFGGREVLHKNEIGHDTLINYVGTMIDEYEILCKIIIDKFPAIYIDEYQDTHEEVIRVLDKVLNYSEEYEIEFLVALFGDPVQSIYSNNLSCQVLDREMKLVSKNINRRSHNNVIGLINNIRGEHQDIRQKSIFKNKDQGVVNFDSYSIPKDEQTLFIKEKIEEVKSSWSINDNNKLTCMVLRNKNLTELCGFYELYNIISKLHSDKSTFLRFDSVNEEFLNDDITRLGRMPYMLYNLIKPIFFLKYDESKLLTDIFSNEVLETSTLDDVINCLDDLRNSEFNNIEDYVSYILRNINSEDDSHAPYGDLNIYKVDNFDDFKKKLICEITDNPSDKVLGLIDDLMNVELSVIYNWLIFILDFEYDEEVNYLTCHSSKGLEFNNVVAILDDEFGYKFNGKKEKEKFSSLLNSDLDKTLDFDLEVTRNLLYVVCSRAIVNLQVIIFSEKLGGKLSFDDLIS